MSGWRADRLRLDPNGLLGLRRSLNTPVVSLPGLPRGPASAAILAFLEGQQHRIALTVRSLRNGAVALYQLDGDDAAPEGDLAPAPWMAALSIGESLGFVFDDDELATGGNDALERALVHCRELLEPGEVSRNEAGDALPAFAGSSDLPTDELLLDTLADEDPESPGPPVTRASDAAPGQLTKFRPREGQRRVLPERRAQPGGLGRRPVGVVRLVRRSAQKTEGRPSPYLQLLGQF